MSRVGASIYLVATATLPELSFSTLVNKEALEMGAPMTALAGPLFISLALASDLEKRAESSTQVDDDVARDLGILWAALFAAFLVYHLFVLICRLKRIRIVTSGRDAQQHAKPSPVWSAIKKHFFSAPLFTKRRSRDIMLGKRLTLGFVPSRIESFAIAAYIAVNIILAFTNIPWNGHGMTAGGLFRNRVATLAAMNLLPLVVFASRNNPLIALLGISYNTFNLIHRWLGRIVAVEALMHALSHVFLYIRFVPDGHSKLRQKFKTSHFYQEGLIGVVAVFVILIFSQAVVRRAMYETFLLVHQLLVILFLAVIWLHTKDAGVWQNRLIIATVALWAAERFIRVYRIVRMNFNISGRQHITRCDVVDLEGDAVRVTVRLARSIKTFPGQHAFLYVPAIGLHTCHPFSLAWGSRSNQGDLPGDHIASDWSADAVAVSDSEMEKGDLSPTISSQFSTPSRRRRYSATTRGDSSILTFIIRRRNGFTARLHDKVLRQAGDSMLNLLAFVEGPYGSQSLSSYGTVLLIAGGVGITHHLLQIRTLLREYEQGKGAAKRIALVWVVQYLTHFSWVQPEIMEMLDTTAGRQALRVSVYVTRPNGADKGIQQRPNLVLSKGSQPNVSLLVEEILLLHGEQHGAAVVNVCGSGSLSDDVRAATRKLMGVRSIDYTETSFGW